MKKIVQYVNGVMEVNDEVGNVNFQLQEVVGCLDALMSPFTTSLPLVDGDCAFLRQDSCYQDRYKYYLKENGEWKLANCNPIEANS